MWQRFRKWIRVVLPAEWLIPLFIVAYILVWTVWRIQFALASANASQSEFILVIGIFAVTLAYASFRVIYFSPVENRRYGMWLKEQPWSHGQPLPLGPWHCVWQDALVVGTLSLLAFLHGFSIFSVATWFLITYSVLLCAGLARVEAYWPACLAAFLLGWLVLGIRIPLARFVVAAAMYIPAYAGIQQMLRAFPFSIAMQERLKLATESSDRLAMMGWPVPPEQAKLRWSNDPQFALASGLIAAWLFLCIGYQVSVITDLVQIPDFMKLFECLYVFCILTLILLRLVVYLWGHVPPISLLGRVATGRLLIPGYDIVFVAPIVATAAAFMLPAALTHVGVSFYVSISISAGVVVSMIIFLPPNWVDWHYTGHHRIAYRFLARMRDKSNQRNQPTRA